MNENVGEIPDQSALLAQGLLRKCLDAVEGWPSTPEDRAEIAEAVAKGLTEYAAELRS